MNKLPTKIDVFNKGEFHPDYYYLEYDGWHFENRTQKGIINNLLKYIFREIII